MILAPQAFSEHPKLVQRSLWRPVSLYSTLDMLSANILVLGAELAYGSCWTQEVSMQTARASPSLWFALPCLLGRGCMLPQQLEPLPGSTYQTDGCQWRCGKLPGRNNLSTSENTGSFCVRGAAARAEPVLLSGKRCLRFFSCSGLSQAAGVIFPAFLIWFCFLAWKISWNG